MACISLVGILCVGIFSVFSACDVYTYISFPLQMLALIKESCHWLASAEHRSRCTACRVDAMWMWSIPGQRMSHSPLSLLPARHTKLLHQLPQDADETSGGPRTPRVRVWRACAGEGEMAHGVILRVPCLVRHKQIPPEATALSRCLPPLCFAHSTAELQETRHLRDS